MDKSIGLSNTQPPALARKTDRRISRTRRLLRDALFDLILEKGYGAVTVEEITQRADLGRTTFYLHYRDKEELLTESIGELVEDLIAQMAQLPLSEWRIMRDQGGEQASPAIILPFQHVAANAQLYRVLLRGEGTFSVNQRLRELIVRGTGEMIRVLQEREQLGDISPQVPIEVFKNHLAGSWIGLVNWWLESEAPYTAEEMALIFQKVALRGAREILGLPPAR